ncbi:Dam family site-specific DNA-(adenine-N6)-methyltransferase [Sporolactobacillus shoreicorticis]|uniref:site-specific DNA-methyltransferase (adenine-specific) n=1 Tax=Sporolactobacillus shoreicorticis TaxID=1923877 RepID=A0ABW5S899_9BACL|nr:Dam family site-specific DNA-(adenine-N6)-methyltransferase [Sporolactobacillus shoreicorticis]MCO7126118.1 Dam family site-specific DNA-(adenine-N6)-methyltransferase [Sporolactobacillus shoreicorticis]
MNLSLSVNMTKPFLRWAGGKTWLVKYLEEILLDKSFNNYHEPFLGGGAVFLAVADPKRAFLSDLNEELVNTYVEVRDNPFEVISILKHYENTKEFYYRIREKNFTDAVQRAARFIFLNQTSYNGLYRVNQKGEYNVPYGFRSKNFLEEEKIILASKKLQNADIICADFTCIKENISEGDLVFLDPPYTVSHNNNGFIKYNQQLFSLEDQKRLSLLIDFIKERGAYYILTNAAHETIKIIFKKNGDRMIEMSRSSLIGGEHAHRGKVSEYVFTNI